MDRYRGRNKRRPYDVLEVRQVLRADNAEP